VVNGIRGQSYPTMGIWSLCLWTPVTLLRCPSDPTLTGKVILELGRVLLTPPSGPSVWTARDRQTAA